MTLRPLLTLNQGPTDMPPGNAEIMLAIGRLQEGMDRIRDDFAEEKKSAAESRKHISYRHDILASEIVQVKHDIELGSLLSSQVKNEMKALSDQISTKIDKHIESHKSEIVPALEDWNHIKRIGLGITGVLALSGLTAGAVMSIGIDAIRTALKNFIGG